MDTVADWVWVLPICTLPKLILVGVSLMRPARIAVPFKVNMENKRLTLLARTILLSELPLLCGE